MLRKAAQVSLWVQERGKRSHYIHKIHNVSVLLYHLVCSAKYRRVVFEEDVDSLMKDVCLEISKRFEIHFLEIGTDKDHAHFLIQSVPSYSPTKIVRTVKSITAREIFKKSPSIKVRLWGGEFWGKGFFINTVGQHGCETTISAYVRNQGRDKEYNQLHLSQLELKLFD